VNVIVVALHTLVTYGTEPSIVLFLDSYLFGCILSCTVLQHNLIVVVFRAVRLSHQVETVDIAGFVSRLTCRV